MKGPVWATGERDTFPVKSVHDLKLGAEEMKNFNDELVDPNVTDNEWIAKQLGTKNFVHVAKQGKGRLDDVSLRYQFSTYVIDPNRFSFRKIVRIVGLVFKFCMTLKKKIGKSLGEVDPENVLPDRFQI